MLSPVTYSRGTPSPKPAVPSSRTQRTRTLSVSLRECEACLIALRRGMRTWRAVSSLTLMRPSCLVRPDFSMRCAVKALVAQPQAQARDQDGADDRQRPRDSLQPLTLAPAGDDHL